MLWTNLEFDLIERFKDQPAVCAMHSYKLMQRVLSEQCEIKTDDTGGPKVEVEKPAEIPSDSLQNPSDPDATQRPQRPGLPGADHGNLQLQ